jgi:hypothetical protein
MNRGIHPPVALQHVTAVTFSPSSALVTEFTAITPTPSCYIILGGLLFRAMSVSFTLYNVCGVSFNGKESIS